MLRIEVRFPLGVYHALAPDSFGKAEWPPSPVRLVGALLAATHESGAVDVEAGRAVLSQLCEAKPPELLAPRVSCNLDQPANGSTMLAQIRGASRWAPRNRDSSESKKNGASFRRVAGDQTEVFKGGTVVGDQTIEFRWPDLDLTEDELTTLGQAAEETTFLGTSRSPVQVLVHASDQVSSNQLTWKVASVPAPNSTEVRVPTKTLLSDFDLRHGKRRSHGKHTVQKVSHLANQAMGSSLPYLPSDELADLAAEETASPRRWGDMLIIALDTGRPQVGSGSELQPRAKASYLVARSLRSTLLSTYGPAGSAEEAPPILRGHGSEPHAAFVPLPHVGNVANRVSKKGERQPIPADGLIKGIAIILPHEELVPDVADQRLRVEEALHHIVLGERRRPVSIPGGGQIRFKLIPPSTPPLRCLEEPLYRGPSRVWETVTPVVHARRRTSTGPRGISRQIETDCQFAGLPKPVQIEVLKDPPLAGAPNTPLPASAIPPDWRSSMTGPSSHLRLTFSQPIEGPILLGKASHFGLGLCRPAKSQDNTTQLASSNLPVDPEART